MAPYRAILRYYPCDTPYCEILFKGGQQSPKTVRYPPSVLSFTQAHLCGTPVCNISRDKCAIPHKLGQPVCRTKLPRKVLISKRKMVRKTTRNFPEKLSALFCCVESPHRHYSKNISPRIPAQNQIFFHDENLQAWPR